MVLFLVNLIEACVRAEHLRNDDAVRGLIVLKKGCNDSWKGKRTTVKSVAELGLAVFITITAMQTISLISLEVGNR